MGSRIRENPERIFELFAEIARPTDPSQAPFVLQKFPDDYSDEEILNSIPKFAFPCEAESTAVDHFTFVQTDIESKFKFGFCRHGTGAYTCLCIISALPWYEIFYRLLNELAEILNRSEDNHVGALLTAVYAQDVTPPGEEVVAVTPNLKERFSFITPDPQNLPTIPENRNLTEYYNAVDTSNMMIIFASMLFERRILVISKKLSRLTACLHGSASLIYPMHWQHLYIPVLPPHLIDYCSAPMPFLIGIHSTLMAGLQQKQELGDAVVLDADNNTVTTEYDDLGDLPPEIVSALKKKLKALQTEKMKNVLGDGVARIFLKTLVALIGGYRDALKFRPGEQITFDSEAFIQSRPSSMQPFLEKMLHLQIFEQFINDRLDLLNAGLGFTDEFEREANSWADKSGSQSKYKEWLVTAKRQGRKLRREGKDRWVEFTSRVKDRSKKAYKDLRSKIDERKKEEEAMGWSGLNRTGPTTLSSPQLRTVRVGEQPRRPPAPDLRARSLRSDSPVTRRTSYEKAMSDEVRTRESLLGISFHRIPKRPPPPKQRPISRARQYKVLSIDDLNGDDREAMRGSRHTSQDDSDLGSDLAYHRVSVDLMNDADIQQVFKKSYSLEDLTRLTQEVEEPDQGQDALVVFYQDHGSSNVSLGTDSVSGLDSGASSDRSKPPTPVPRRPRPGTPSSQQSSDRDSPRGSMDVGRPLPPPRKHNTDISAQPLIKLDLMGSDSDRSSDGPLQQRQSSSTSSLGPDDQDNVRFYPKYSEFDPLEGALDDREAKCGDQGQGVVMRSHPQDAGVAESEGFPEDEDNNNPLLKPRNRNSIIRHNAFYNIQRPPSVKRRPSPTPQATDAQTIKEARTAFIQSELVKPTQAPVTTSLDLFDPLLTGQLVVDLAPPLASGGHGSGSSLDNYSSQGGVVDTVAQPSQEENLLKEWNLDFSRMGITANKTPPPIPPKPTIGQGMRPAYQVSPVHMAPPSGAHPNLTGQGDGMLRASQAGQFYQSQPINFNVPAQGFGVQPQGPATQPGPGSLGSFPFYGTTQTMQPPMLRPRRPTPTTLDKNVNVTLNNPFGDLNLLAGQPPGTQARPTSYPVAQPRNSWETFE